MLDQFPELLSGHQIPLWLKVSFTFYVCLIVPAYWGHYGPGNFLWFSDVAFLLTVPALWFESGLLASMLILAVGVLDVAWLVDFIVRLITGRSLTGLSSYMFDRKNPLTVRALSLFHVVQPVILVFMIYRLGYDRRV